MKFAGKFHTDDFAKAVQAGEYQGATAAGPIVDKRKISQLVGEFAPWAQLKLSPVDRVIVVAKVSGWDY